MQRHFVRPPSLGVWASSGVSFSAFSSPFGFLRCFHGELWLFFACSFGFGTVSSVAGGTRLGLDLLLGFFVLICRAFFLVNGRLDSFRLCLCGFSSLGVVSASLFVSTFHINSDMLGPIRLFSGVVKCWFLLRRLWKLGV